ncbi:hypothetical protein [Photobacterium kasasachensis]|uniref:hypothetical protein n=1 Tax=Photobacterium kasasachensis TaxID=2910240 RepID=UPI003D125255
MKTNRLLINLVLLALLIVSMKIQAEPPSQTDELYKAALASSEGQAWTLEAWRNRLGEDSNCIQGTDWIFYADGRLIKRTCDNGQVREKKHNWSMSSKASGPVELTIDENVHWIEILTDKINEPGLPPTEVLIAKIQEHRVSPEKSVELYELRRTND